MGFDDIAMTLLLFALIAALLGIAAWIEEKMR
jgi:hypothetical protein